MGHRDLGEYYWSIGDPSQAIKHFNKSREYCTSSQHILDFSLNVLQLLIETCDYAHIATYVFKAEGALTPPETKDKKGAAPPAGSAAAAAAASAALNPDREKAVAKMELANAISYLSVGNYEKAAFAFSKLSRSLDDWLGKVTLFSTCAHFRLNSHPPGHCSWRCGYIWCTMCVGLDVPKRH